MTADLFVHWLKRWDWKLTIRNWKVLIVDPCFAHKVDIELNTVKQVFPVANATAVL